MNLNQTVIAYGSGKRNKHEKGSYIFNKLLSPHETSSYWSESTLNVDFGLCYTLKLNDTKNGFHFFLLNTNFSYIYVLHDFNFFVHSANPLTFPRIYQIVRIYQIMFFI